MTEVINFFLNITEGMGYVGVFILMTVESSFIPFPSEIVIPPAAYLAANGSMNIFLIIIYGVLGSLCGASINYFLALHLGRKVIYSLSKLKFSKYLLISEENLHKSEHYIKKYGAISTFFGRLLPAVRQLISIPAGFSKMNYSSFLFFTFLGSGLWVVILAILGYFFGANQEILSNYYFELKWGAVILVFLIIIGFIIKKKFLKRS